MALDFALTAVHRTMHRIGTMRTTKSYKRKGYIGL